MVWPGLKKESRVALADGFQTRCGVLPKGKAEEH